MDAADVSILKQSFYSPKLQLVVVFSKSDVMLLPSLELLSMYFLGLVAVGEWTFLFFSLSTIQNPNLKVFKQLKIFCAELAGKFKL